MTETSMPHSGDYSRVGELKIYVQQTSGSPRLLPVDSLYIDVCQGTLCLYQRLRADRDGFISLLHLVSSRGVLFFQRQFESMFNVDYEFQRFSPYGTGHLDCTSGHAHKPCEAVLLSIGTFTLADVPDTEEPSE